MGHFLYFVFASVCSTSCVGKGCISCCVWLSAGGGLVLRRFPKKDTARWLEAAVGTDLGEVEHVTSEQLALRKHRVPAERQIGFRSEVWCEGAYKLLCKEHS